MEALRPDHPRRPFRWLLLLLALRRFRWRACEMTGQRTFKVPSVNHGKGPSKLANALTKYLKALCNNKESQFSRPVMQVIAAQVMMSSVDARWMSHLRYMDALKTGISLRAVGHRNPGLKYEEEAHKFFAFLAQSMHEDYLQALLRGQLTVGIRRCWKAWPHPI